MIIGDIDMITSKTIMELFGEYYYAIRQNYHETYNYSSGLGPSDSYMEMYCMGCEL